MHRPDWQCALGPQREKARRARGRVCQASGCLSRSPRREKVRRIWGEGAQASGCLSRQAGEDTKRRRNWIHAFVEYPKTGTALNAGPAPYRAAGSLSSADGESTDTPVWGKTSVARTRWVLPTSVCSAPPSPQLDWTELANLNKRSPPPACVRVEIRHRRGGKQKPNKQREPL